MNIKPKTKFSFKYLFLFIFVFILSSFVFASDCFVDQPCTWSVVNTPPNTEYVEISYILDTIFYPLRNTTSLSFNSWYDIETFNDSGTVVGCAYLYDNESGLIDNKCSTKEINVEGESYMVDIIILTILMFLLISAFAIKNGVIGILGSLGLVIYSVGVLEWSSGIGLITLSSGLILSLYFLFVVEQS